MNLRFLSLIGLVLAAALPGRAQNGDDSANPRRTPEELRDLVGPVALYPDPLISLILPASTVPSDVVLAARYVKSGADPDGVEDKAWDSSVKALVRYPDTLTWMDENLEWTTQLGDAFNDQPADVMNAIQDLRAKAKSMGNLVDTPQQRIVEDDSDIRIVPAQPDYIYEPRYDPQVVYYERPSAQPLLSFGEPWNVGSWLRYDFDWRRHRLYRGDWHDGWDYHHDRDRRDRDDVYVNNRLTNVQAWHVDAKRRPESVRRPSSDRPSAERPRVTVARPKPVVTHFKSGEVRRGEAVGGPDHRRDGSGRSDSANGGKMGSDKPGGRGKGIAPTTPAPFVKGDSRPGDGRFGNGRPNSDGRGDSSKSRGDGSKPKGEGGTTHGDVVKPKSDAPGTRGDSPKSKGEGPSSRGDVVRPKSDAPGTRGDSPKSKGDGPSSRGDSPKPKGDGPSSRGDSPKSKGDGPSSRGDSPKPKGDGPSSRGDSPKPKSEGQKSRADSPKPQAEAPKPHADAPKPRAEAPKPHSEAPKSRGDAPKPKGDSPKPHSDAPKPKPEAAKSHSDGSKDGKKKDKDKKD